MTTRTEKIIHVDLTFDKSNLSTGLNLAGANIVSSDRGENDCEPEDNTLLLNQTLRYSSAAKIS